MKEYDRLPPELRAWVATAALPWSARSVRQAYARAMTRTKDPAQALAELDRVERRNIARDARRVWGQSHPAVG